MLTSWSCDPKRKLTQPFQLGETVSLLFGQRADCAECKEVTVRVLSIKDNRCPKGVNCVQAGQADVTFDITGSINQTVELTTKRSGKQQAKVGGYTLTLKDVTPYPVDGVNVPNKQRQAVFILEGA